MKRTEWLQETRKMRFEEAYEGWRSGGFSQEEAAMVLGVCDRTFRRYLVRYDEGGLDALMDKRLTQVSHRCSPIDEVIRSTEQYQSCYFRLECQVLKKLLKNVGYFRPFIRIEAVTIGIHRKLAAR